MADFPILSILTFLPLVGAAFILLMRGDEKAVSSGARKMALWTSVITFALSLFLWFSFDPTTAAFQFEEKRVWLVQYNIGYHLGVDGISVLFVLLTSRNRFEWACKESTGVLRQGS